jgi:diguanylate cyclase (GGDEF)-like protein
MAPASFRLRRRAALPDAFMIVVASALLGAAIGFAGPSLLPAEMLESPAILILIIAFAALVSALTWVRLQRSTQRIRARLTELESRALQETELRKRLEAALEFHVEKESLTDLATARYFTTRAELAVARAKRTRSPISLLLMSVDGLSDISARLGPVGTDDVLRNVARICRESVRDVDLPARLDDQVFAILLEDANVDGACVVVDRIRNKVAENEDWCEGDSPEVTVSFGVIEMDASCHFLNDALKWGREALEFALSQGTNKVCIARDAGGDSIPGIPAPAEKTEKSAFSHLRTEDIIAPAA